MTSVTFLVPKKGTSTKTFTNVDGVWVLKNNYKAGKFFAGYCCEIDDLKGFYDLIEENQEHNCFMVHGGIIDGTDTTNMVRRKRANHLDGLAPTLAERQVNLICFDIDGYAGTIAEYIHKELPEEFHSADFVYQYSASYGLTEGEEVLKCHLFFWLAEQVMTTDLKSWAHNSHIPKLDSSVLSAAQPIYTQRRICENEEDPIHDFLGHIIKEGELNWKPPFRNDSQEKRSSKNKDYDLKESIHKIMTAHNYHDAIRSTALSMINRKIPTNTVKSILKGAMEGSALQDRRWKERYDDIDRSVNSAADIVDNITIDDFSDWVLSAGKVEVLTDYAMKCVKFNSIDLTNAVNAVCQKTGYGTRDVRSMIKDAKKEHSAEKKKLAQESKTEERLAIGIHELEYSISNELEVFDQVCKILANSKKEPHIFKNGSGLVSIVIDYPKTIQQCTKLAGLKENYPPMPIIRQYVKPHSELEYRMKEDIALIDSAGKDMKAPTDMLNNVGSGMNKAFKPLTGVIEHPYIDKDWILIDKNGYDSTTGLYAMLHNKLKIKPMGPKAAYKYLTEVVFDEFPFGSELDKAVAVAAMMTAVQRPTIAGNSGLPGFGIVSPRQSSGKTTLAQLISHAIYNRPVAAQSWTQDEEELGKHLLGIFQEGHSCVLFDNIKQGSTVSSDRLATAMTNDMFSGRQLGENKTIRVASSVIWMFTGNGISFVGDFATRIYPINIVPKMESPDTRRFKRDDIGQWAVDNRKHIISAVLSIVNSGKNSPEMKSSTRFKEWDVFVRRPLFYASGIDINEAIKKNQREDTDNLNRNRLICELREIFGEKKFTTKDILKSAFGLFEAGETDLGTALEEVLDNKAKSSISVGKYLSTMVDNIFGDLILTKYISNVVRWKIEKIEKEDDI